MRGEALHPEYTQASGGPNGTRRVDAEYKSASVAVSDIPYEPALA